MRNLFVKKASVAMGFYREEAIGGCSHEPGLLHRDVPSDGCIDVAVCAANRCSE